MRYFLNSLKIFIIVILFISLNFVTCCPRPKVVTLRFSDWHLSENVWNKSLTEAIDEFKKQNPDIKVILESVPYKDKDYKYITESEAGMAPDIYHIHANSLQLYFSKGYAMDLSRYIKAAGGEKFLKNWYELPVKTCRYNGKLMAMPADFMSMVLYYNGRLFKEAGIDPQKPPTTWEEFLDVNKRLTIDKNNDGYVDQWGFTAIGAKDPGFELRFSPFIWGFGGDYLTEDLKHSALNRPESIAGFKYFVELYTKYRVIPPGILKRTPQGSRIQLANQQAAMSIGSGWTMPIVNNINPKLKANEVLEVAPIPYGPKQVTSAWLSAWVMSSNTKYPKEAWKLMEFITSKDMELKWFKDNSVLSSRKDVSGAAPEILNDKYAKVIASQLSYARLVPQIAEWPEIIDTVTEAVQKAISETKTPEEAIYEAHIKVEEILRHKNN